VSQKLYHKITFYMVNVSGVVVQFSYNNEMGADLFVDHSQGIGGGGESSM